MQITRESGSCRLLITVDPIFLADRFARMVLAAVQDCDRELVLDLAQVQMLHSPSLGELTRIFISLGRRDIGLTLTGLNDFNRRLLSTTQLDRIFTIV